MTRLDRRCPARLSLMLSVALTRGGAHGETTCEAVTTDSTSDPNRSAFFPNREQKPPALVAAARGTGADLYAPRGHLAECEGTVTQARRAHRARLFSWGRVLLNCDGARGRGDGGGRGHRPRRHGGCDGRGRMAAALVSRDGAGKYRRLLPDERRRVPPRNGSPRRVPRRGHTLHT